MSAPAPEFSVAVAHVKQSRAPCATNGWSGSLQVLQMLHNSNIVSCIESFRHQGKLCIVMDYCSEGEPRL